MPRYLRLLALFTRIELQHILQYRVNLAIELLEELAVIATSLAAVLVLFTYTTQLNGWTLPQMLVLLGVYYIVQGAQGLVLETSFETFMEQVRLGTLDFTLLKPVNTQFFVSTRYVQITQSAQAVLGFVVLGVGLAAANASLTLLDEASFVLMLACGLVLVYAVLLVLSTLAFWFVRVENLLAIFWAFLDAGRFPVDVYPGWLRITLSTVVPIGLAVTTPAQAIAGRLDPVTLVGTCVAAVVSLFVSHWFWRRGLANYTGASA